MSSSFKGPINLAVIVCRKVLDGSAPILSVSHDEDGEWQFLCDGDHAHNKADQARLVAMAEALALDPSLEELGALPTGFRAWRSAQGALWQVGPSPSDRHD